MSEYRDYGHCDDCDAILNLQSELSAVVVQRDALREVLRVLVAEYATSGKGDCMACGLTATECNKRCDFGTARALLAEQEPKKHEHNSGCINTYPDCDYPDVEPV